MKKYRLKLSTRNAGEYIGDNIVSLSAAKRVIRANHPRYRIRWRDEGGSVCAYLSADDMTDEDKAVARIVPVEVA